MLFRMLFVGLLSLVFSCSKGDAGSTGETLPNDNQAMDAEEDMTEMGTLMGAFVEDAHPTEGKAVINGERTELLITDFKSDEGPILELYLATDVDASEFVTLGELQGLEGDYLYDLPSDIDFETHKFLLVWCVEFSVSFGHAVLE